MRKLTDFAEPSRAKALGDYLLAQGIPNQIDHEEGLWSVWVHDDDHLDAARERLQTFENNPGDPEIRQAVERASEIRTARKREAKRVRSKPIDMRTHWHRESMRPMAVSSVLVAISIGVFVVQNFVPDGMQYARWLFISDYRSPFLPEILRGQVWRLFTPMFLHFGLLHIFFNMSWMVFLGPMIEWRKGPWIFLAMVLVVALISNFAQYLFHGPAFGGMSGVVCGLFGYVWMMGKYNPALGMGVDKNMVIYFVAFLIISLIFLGSYIANTAHFVGLGVGMLWGYADSGRLRFQ